MKQLASSVLMIGAVGALSTFIGLKGLGSLGNPYRLTPDVLKRARLVTVVMIWSVIVLAEGLVLVLTLR
jgi:hypothetical protein